MRSDYAGATLWQVAMNGLPALVLARLGAEDAAVYGIVWTIAVSLYLIPSGMGQSMIAHTAGDPAQAAAARRAMVRRSLTLVVPAAVVLSVGAYPVLWLFGEHYAQEGAWALALAALSAIPQVSRPRRWRRRGCSSGCGCWCWCPVRWRWRCWSRRGC